MLMSWFVLGVLYLLFPKGKLKTNYYSIWANLHVQISLFQYPLLCTQSYLSLLLVCVANRSIMAELKHIVLHYSLSLSLELPDKTRQASLTNTTHSICECRDGNAFTLFKLYSLCVRVAYVGSNKSIFVLFSTVYIVYFIFILFLFH